MAGEEEISFEVNLNEILIGKRTLRYIYLHHPDVISTVRDESRESIPLFLGSDVLLQCNVSRGNWPRLHAKHAKRGLATKLNFPSGCRVLGIHGTTRGVWFYSIQGTFKIAFDYYSREDQDGCLRHLQKIWRRQILDPVLKKEIQVAVGKGMEKCSAAETEKIRDIVFNSETHDNICDAAKVVNHINSTIDNLALETDNEVVQQELRLLKIYVSYIDCKGISESFVNESVNLLKSCLRLLPAIPENNFAERFYSSKRTSVSEGSVFSESDSFLESCDSSGGDRFSECNSLLAKETFLLEVARWLGTEFANYYSVVNERVTAFKQKHIKNIDGLPSAELLIKEVFPRPMQTLLCHWLRLATADNENQTNRDSENAPKLYPVVQLILELANQSLLSGVAHVLYSRLIRSETV